LSCWFSQDYAPRVVAHGARADTPPATSPERSLPRPLITPLGGWNSSVEPSACELVGALAKAMDIHKRCARIGGAVMATRVRRAIVIVVGHTGKTHGEVKQDGAESGSVGKANE